MEEKVRCICCHELLDALIMFEGQQCFICTVQNHFENLKKEKTLQHGNYLLQR